MIIIPPTLFSPCVAAPLQNMVLHAQPHMGRPALGGFVIKAEMAIKVGTGRLKLTVFVQRYFQQHLTPNNFQLLPIGLDHVTCVETLPRHHRDPFDRPGKVRRTGSGISDPLFDDYAGVVMKYINWFRVRLATALLVATLSLAEGLAQNHFGTPVASPPAPVVAPPGDTWLADAPTNTPADSAATATATPHGASDQAGAVGPAFGEPPAPVKKEPPPPSGPSRRLSIHLESQRFTYAESGQVLRAGPVSSGKRGYGTPAGSFQVLSKQRHKVSSRYAGYDGRPASMPYAIQFRSNYFIHQGRLPGYAASHGCVRLRGPDAQFLFSRLRPGDPVLITR